MVQQACEFTCLIHLLIIHSILCWCVKLLWCFFVISIHGHCFLINGLNKPVFVVLFSLLWCLLVHIFPRKKSVLLSKHWCCCYTRNLKTVITIFSSVRFRSYSDHISIFQVRQYLCNTRTYCLDLDLWMREQTLFIYGF